MAPQATLHLHQTAAENSLEPAFPQLAKAKTASKISRLMDVWKLRFGAGKLALKEYFDLRLFDEEIYKNLDKKAFVGLEATRKIWFQANFRVDQFAMANNKIASAIWFAAHGLPILPTIAIFHDCVGRPSERLLRNEAELRSFLKNSDHYPLFGKPIEGCRSVGSVSIESYVASNDRLITTAGQFIPLDDFIAFVKAHAASGYQLQLRVSPHERIREMCGNRLATVRLLTILRQGKPELLRACWKIPAGMQAADNFWRSGNLLAQLDIKSGRVVRVIRQTGGAFEEISHHPDTGVRILGMDVPNWHEVTELALDGAKLLDELPLVGWDIAPVDAGAVLVEANVTPDLQLHQIADRRGILDPNFVSFLKQRKLDAATFARIGKRTVRQSTLGLVWDLVKDGLCILMPGTFGHRSNPQPGN